MWISRWLIISPLHVGHVHRLMYRHCMLGLVFQPQLNASRRALLSQCCRSFLPFEDNLLYLHVVEQVISLHGVCKRHDVLMHEATLRQRYS